MSNNNISDEARELALFIENDGDLYRQQTLPIITNLQKKFTKGLYDSAKAQKLWKHLADNGAKKYTFDHVDRQGKRHWSEIAGYGIFTVAMRKEAAADLETAYLDHVEEGYAFKTKPRAKNPNTRTSSDVRSPTRTSTEAQTSGNFTSTVTGGAGDGDTITNIYPGNRKANPRRDGRFNVWKGANYVNNKIVHGYNVEFLNKHIGWVKTMREVNELIAEHEAKRLGNPASRIGTAKPRRKSQITKKPPSKRLVLRRMENSKKGYFPNPIADKIALHFNAGNDTNGNPRRLFVVVNTAGAVVGAYDEGYNGEAAVTKHFPGIAVVGRFDITPAQRKSLLKEYGK